MGPLKKCIRVLVFAAAIWAAPTAASAIETSVQVAPEMIAARAESGVDGAAASPSSTALPTAVERAASPDAGGGASPAASSRDAASGSRAAAAGDAGIGNVSPTAPAAANSAAEQVARLESAARVIGADGSDRDLVLDGPNDGIATDAPFEIEIQRFRGSDVRVRLFDESHRQVPSTDRLESSETSTRYRLKPQEPLNNGSRYVLTIEGLRTDQPTDSAGRRYRQERIELKTAGEPPLPVIKKSPPRRKQPTRKHQRR